MKLLTYPNVKFLPSTPFNIGGVVFLHVMLVRELQLQKAQLTIFVTLSGIVKLVRELHSNKTRYSIVVKLSGSVMLVRELQPEYLQPVITQYFASNKSEIWS